MQPGDSRCVRLDLAHAVPVDPAHPGHTVGEGAPLELAQTSELGLVECDDELAARDKRNLPLLAIALQQRDTTAAQLGLQRSRRVIDPRVDDPAVAPGLVQRNLPLLLEHGHGRVGAELRQPSRHSKTDDPGTDHTYPHAGHALILV